jgi:hypothetical protein
VAFACTCYCLAMTRAARCALLAGVIILSATIYAKAGISDAFFAADDFQWLDGGHVFGWPHLLQVSSRAHFYRPLIEAWFALEVAACGNKTACYHLTNVAVHLLNVALVYSLGLALFRKPRVALLGALIFAIEPASTQAVVWVSAVTGLLATSFFVASLLLQVLSWKARTGRARLFFEVSAVLLFGTALLSHEAAITLPVVSWAMWRLWRPGDLNRRFVLLAGAVLTVGAFVTATLLANYRNYVFTEGHYSVGFHAVSHLFQYLVALYVGPGWWLAYLLCAVGIAALLVVSPITRFGTLWLLVTLLPYIWFTWGNSSRYLYLPSIGFGWAVAGALEALCDYLSARHGVRRPLGDVVFGVAAAFMIVRFAQFDSAAVRGQIREIDYWRTYASRVVANSSPPAGGRLYAAAPVDDVVGRAYVEPMMRWMYHDYTLIVVIRE